jgi:hypothetical protein
MGISGFEGQCEFTALCNSVKIKVETSVIKQDAT